MGREGVDLKVSRTFYTAVAQVVLLFGEDTWVLTPRMEKALDSFQSRVARRITGRQPRRKKDRIWDYLPLGGGTEVSRNGSRGRTDKKLTSMLVIRTF